MRALDRGGTLSIAVVNEHGNPCPDQAGSARDESGQGQRIVEYVRALARLNPGILEQLPPQAIGDFQAGASLKCFEYALGAVTLA